MRHGTINLNFALSASTHEDLDSGPDAFKRGPYFDAQVVVSQDVTGQPLSRFGDATWNLSSMSTDGGRTTCNLHFFRNDIAPMPPGNITPGLVTLIRDQQKALLWLHMDTGRQRAQKTTANANHALNQLAQSAFRRSVTLFDLLCDPPNLGEVVESMNTSYANAVGALVKTLWRHRNLLGIDIPIRLGEIAKKVLAAGRTDIESLQTPIIPSRIYCALLGRLLESLDEIESNIDIILDAFRRERTATLSSPAGYTVKQHQWHRDKQLRELRKAMRARGWSKGSLQNFIAGEISSIRLKLINVVVAFTGMRIGEAQILPLKSVLEDVEHGGAVHHLVNGYSHKLNGGQKKPATWVTSREGHRAIMLAQRIASTILEVIGGGDSNTDDVALLFCSTDNPYKMETAASIYKRLDEELIPAFCPVITQGDIDELNAMELERNWLRTGIEVGSPWPLTFHQYRRSLSVYAHRSGMVSLPALKCQLQHITDEMRAYYSDGFCRAVNLVFDKEHFSHEWNAARSESSFLAYSLAALFSDDDLIGGISGKGATRMARTISSRSKAETLKLFRDGTLAYRETILGGCAAVEHCDHTPLEPIPWDCLEKDCSNAVIFGKRLDLLIKTQETVVAVLSDEQQGTVEHRLEAEHLKVLLKARISLKGAQ